MFRLIAIGMAVANGPKQQPSTPPPKLGGFGWPAVIGIGIVVAIMAADHRNVAIFVIGPLVCAAIVIAAQIAASVSASRPTDPSSMRRMKQVQALLSSPCPLCFAGAGASCIQTPGDPLALIDGKWNTLCHFPRMEKAVQLRMINRADVIAQWDGKIPEGLNL